MEKNDTIKKIGELIKDIRTCMFVTQDNNRMFIARPMSTQDTVFDGSVWFMTDKRSNKCKQIEANPTVGLEYSDGNGVTFVSLSGKGEFVHDKAKIKDFWNEFFKAWFEGPEDPNIILIEVKIVRAEYWDNKGGKLGGLADIAIGAITGKTNTLDEHDIYTF